MSFLLRYKYNGTLHPHMRDEPPPPPPRENSAEHPRETAWDAPPPYDALTKTGQPRNKSDHNLSTLCIILVIVTDLDHDMMINIGS